MTTKKPASEAEAVATHANAFLKDGVEKAAAAFGQINEHSKKNLEAVVASATAATKGAETLSTSAAAYARKTLEGQVAHVRALAGATSPQEVMELQTTYAKTFFEGYVAEMKSFNETLASAMKASWAPIGARFTAAAETFGPIV
jgi:phasin family protein